MKHVPDEQIQAMLDSELENEALDKVRQHLESCPRCKLRLDEIEARRTRVAMALSSLESDLDPNFNNPRQAYQRFVHTKMEVDPKMNKKTIFRPVWVVVVLVALVAASFAFPQTRALAGQFLDLFRVKNVTVLSLDPESIHSLSQKIQSGGMESFMQIFSDQFQELESRKDPVDTQSVEEASSLAGFQVKQVQGVEATNYNIEYGTTVSYVVDRATLQELLDTMQIDYQIDPALDGTEVTAVIPNVVTTNMGDCSSGQSSSCLRLVQSPSPVVTTSKPVDMASIVSAGLQVLGWDATQAEDFANSVDWTNTLVLPLPNGQVQHSQVQVNGSDGVLLDYSQGDTSLKAVIWASGGQVYTLTGDRSADEMVSLANQVQ